jgi:Uma2 family endonuclease
VAGLHSYTFRDYLDVEERSPIRYEYFDGDILALALGTPEHAAICALLIFHLGTSTSGKRCRTYTSGLRIRVLATGLATYADAAVVCGPLERDPESPTHCTNPTALFEVLSPATEGYDRGAKREHYQRIPSLRDYVILAQDRPYAEQWTRDGEDWKHQVIDVAGEIVLDSIGSSFPLRDLYSFSTTSPNTYAS